MFYIIYQTTNQVNGKTYIGKHKTANLEDGYIGSGKLLRRAIAKYGVENFQREVLYYCSNATEMNLKEAELVTAEFIAEQSNYNLKFGGEGGFDFINKSLTSDDYRNRGALGRQSREQTIKSNPSLELQFSQKMRDIVLKLGTKPPGGSSGFLNKQHPIEWKRWKSVEQTGINNSQYGTMWITNGLQSRKILKTDPIPDGWEKGRKCLV